MVALTIEWVAGLFEGEGCISINKTRQGQPKEYWCLELQLTSTDEDVVQTLHSLVGVGKVYVSHSAADQAKGKKKAWMWRVMGRQAEELGWKLMPYLHERRRSRFGEALLAIHTFREANPPAYRYVRKTG